jgi:hypothetical protein
MDKTLNVIEKACSLWQYNLKLGKTYNTPVSIGFSDGYYELLTCVEHDLKGTGSISHGYDHNNGAETKGTSWVQPKKCNDCGAKIHFFAENCICGSNNFKYINDSRWGIDANAHFVHKVPDYHLWVLYPETYTFKCKKFFLKQYIISSSNQAFNEILKVQLDKGNSNGKNFIPYSSDFYVSNPKEVSSFTIIFDDVFDIIVDREVTQTIVYNDEIIRQISPMLDKSFIHNKDNYLYEELIPYINVRDKKTTHGKERGTTKRRNQ